MASSLVRLQAVDSPSLLSTMTCPEADRGACLAASRPITQAELTMPSSPDDYAPSLGPAMLSGSGMSDNVRVGPLPGDDDRLCVVD